MQHHNYNKKHRENLLYPDIIKSSLGGWKDNTMDYLMKVQESVKYIEDNLTNSISFEDLARQAYFSSYYFHRLFQSIVGEPVMEYIRRKRLLHAADDLLYCDDNIIDIAFKYQFNSHDVFTRAFKRLYGVTPQKYRKLNKNTLPFNINSNPKEDNIMLDLNIGQKIQCTTNEKRECLELLNSILEFSSITRKHGLLRLESEIEKFDSNFMRKALQLIVEGVEPNYIRTILQNYIIIGDYKGKALLERILITEGVLSIQSGENSLLIREKLSSFFGEDFTAEIDKYFGNDTVTINGKIRAFYSEAKNNIHNSPETTSFEESLLNLNPRSLQRLLREVEISDIINALKGASGKLQIFMIENVSRTVAILIIDELRESRQIPSQQIIDSQNRMLEAIKKLRADGEIT